MTTPFVDVLPSGLTVVTVEAPHLRNAHCAVYVRAGARYDGDAPGAARVLQRLLLMGTARHPDQKRLLIAAEAGGAGLRSLHDGEHLEQHLPCVPAALDNTLTLLGEVTARPRLSPCFFSLRLELMPPFLQVRGELLSDARAHGRDLELLMNHVMSGTPDTTALIDGYERLTYRRVKQHYRRSFVTGNMVVTVAGPVKRDEVLRSVTRAFRRVRRGPAVAIAPLTRPKTPHELRLLTAWPDLEFRLCFAQPVSSEPGFWPMAFLYVALRERIRRLRAPFIGPVWLDDRQLHDFRWCWLRGTCSPEQLPAAIDALEQAWAPPLTEEELTAARRATATELARRADIAMTLCERYGRAQLNRLPVHTTEEVLRVAGQVTVEDIEREKAWWFHPSRRVIIAVGPRP